MWWTHTHTHTHTHMHTKWKKTRECWGSKISLRDTVNLFKYMLCVFTQTHSIILTASGRFNFHPYIFTGHTHTHTHTHTQILPCPSGIHLHLPCLRAALRFNSVLHHNSSLCLLSAVWAATFPTTSGEHTVVILNHVPADEMMFSSFYGEWWRIKSYIAWFKILNKTPL